MWNFSKVLIRRVKGGYCRNQSKKLWLFGLHLARWIKRSGQIWNIIILEEVGRASWHIGCKHERKKRVRNDFWICFSPFFFWLGNCYNLLRNDGLEEIRFGIEVGETGEYALLFGNIKFEIPIRIHSKWRHQIKSCMYDCGAQDSNSIWRYKFEIINE